MADIKKIKKGDRVRDIKKGCKYHQKAKPPPNISSSFRDLLAGSATLFVSFAEPVPTKLRS